MTPSCSDYGFKVGIQDRVLDMFQTGFRFVSKMFQDTVEDSR